MITNKQLQTALKLFERKFHKQYQEQAKQRKEEGKRDYGSYEHEYASRLQRTMKEFAPLIVKATDDVEDPHKPRLSRMSRTFRS